MSITGMVIEVTTFSLLSLASSYLVFKSRRAQRVIVTYSALTFP
jgi:hypothetical protein